MRDKIVELFGDVPRIELFARQKIDGGVTLGNEIDGEDIRVALNELITGFEEKQILNKAA